MSGQIQIMRFFKGPRPEYRGYVDSLTGNRLAGWASDRVSPRKRLKVEIYCAGVLAGSVQADALREDLAAAGIGDGLYGFSFDIPFEGVTRETVAAKIEGTDFWLFNTVVAAETASVSSDIMNSTARGFPAIEAGLSVASVTEADIAVAADLLQAWQAHTGAKGTKDFIGRKTMWDGIVGRRHGGLVDLLSGNDPRLLAAFFVDIQKSVASEGITQGEASYRDFLAASPEGRRAAVIPFHDMLASLVQYLGLARAECAEQEFEGEALSMSSRQLVARVETALNHGIVPPLVFDGLFGLSVNGRILHARDVQALYAALRAIESCSAAQPHICEIGGGFGKVAHYAWLRGVRRYSIVDLPSVSAMQYFYLRKVLPDAKVRFRHPSDTGTGDEGIDLLFATHMEPGVTIPADIVVNCDSFPEMGDAVCRDYFALIRAWAPLLLSINQEANRKYRGEDRQTVVGHHLPDFGFKRAYRFRSWVRKGFVEELWATGPGSA